MSDIRAFIAVPVDEAICAQFAEVQQRLRQAQADVSWVQTDRVHLTLKFLGNVVEEHIPPLHDALRLVAARTAPFALTMAGVGAFPSFRRPQVLWAGVTEGMTPLAVLAGLVDEAMAAHGFPRETRPFRAHVTLGRVKSPAHAAELRALAEAYRETTFGEMAVTQLRLMRSDLSPQGARYTV
ncbi:MAG TPA: RNA 2',3'-cyclic phosphodiesterase [Armatimonadota bacterium]